MPYTAHTLNCEHGGTYPTVTAEKWIMVKMHGFGPDSSLVGIIPLSPGSTGQAFHLIVKSPRLCHSFFLSFFLSVIPLKFSWQRYITA